MNRLPPTRGIQVLALLAWAVPAVAAGQRIQPLPLDRLTVGVEVAKLFVGENFRFPTSTEEVAVGVPVGDRLLLVVRQGVTYATAGTHTSSWQLSNLLLSAVGERGHTRGELLLGIPLGRTLSDSDYAGDLALLSGLDYRERYVHRWSFGATVSQHWVEGDRSDLGLELGVLGLTRTGDLPAQMMGRYAALLALPLGRESSMELRFQGTAHLNGEYKSFTDRLQNGATLSFWFGGMGPVHGLFVYYPLSDGTRDFVDAVAGVRLRF